jgi:prolyl 4-hydroxylase
VRLTPELSHWITEQLARGCNPEDMVQALVTVGHDEQFARSALSQAPRDAGDSPTATGNLESRGTPRPLGEALAKGTHILQAEGRDVKVLMRLTRPEVLVLGSVLSDEECDALIQESKPKLERSRTVDRASGGTELNAARTSEGTYFNHSESELLLRINRRIAALTAWPMEYGEPLQILHYGIGAEYQPHYDYFDPSDPGTSKLTAQGGQRVATLIIYLNDPQRGGATLFPDLGIEIAAVKGNAVFFSYERPHPDTRTLHAGTPVLEGEKWIATRWLRERAYR